MCEIKVFTLIKIVVKSIIIPLIAVFLLNKYNLFEYIKFVPEDYRYEMGLTAYLTLLEMVSGIIQNILEAQKASVICTFYISENDKDIKNIPLIICDESVGVATISYYLELTGNLKKLRKCEFELALPSWVQAQLNNSDAVLNHVDDKLIWKFDRILPQTGAEHQTVKFKNKISLIKNDNGNNIYISLVPQIKKIYGDRIETNGFKLKNGDE